MREYQSSLNYPYKIKLIIIVAKIAAINPIGTALISKSLNNFSLYLSGQDPKIKLPPEEKGEIAEA